MSERPDDKSPLSQLGYLADKFARDYQDGLNPSIDQYASEHPELADRIRELFPAMVMIEELAPDDESLAADRQELLEGDTPDRLGDYELIREIGRGGMGVVYQARQISLRRTVALKLLPVRAGQQTSAIERFRIEAQAAAKLHHPNIVPVFDVGEESGRRYYAMQFIQGQGLDEIIKELARLKKDRQSKPSEKAGDEDPRPLSASLADSLLSEMTAFPLPESPDVTSYTRQSPASSAACGEAEEKEDHHPEALRPTENHCQGDTDHTGKSASRHSSALSATDHSRSHYFRNVAQIGRHVAQALAYAHEQDVLHRDIKPSNLLLDEHSKIWITDFGLAKTVDQDLTQTGDVIGTLNYMAPERFHGWSDPRSDVYGLGVTLYEMLTLRPAFSGTDRVALMKRVAEQTPPTPAALEKRRASDLDTIIMKAIEKEPARRYQSAIELADDLGRFIRDEPIRARRSSRVEHVARFCRRNPIATTLSVLLVAALVTGLVTTTVFWKRESTQRVNAERSAESAQREREIAIGAVDAYLTAVSESYLINQPGMQYLRRDLLTLALHYYEGFVERHRDDRSLRLELSDAMFRLGMIHSSIDSRETALRFHLEALDIREEELHLDQSLEKRERLADSHAEIAFLRASTGEFELSQASFEIALDIRRDLCELEPTNTSQQRRLAKLLTNQAISFETMHEPERAAESFGAAVEIRRQLADTDDASLSDQMEWVGALNNMGAHFLHIESNEEARPYLEEAQARVPDDVGTDHAELRFVYLIGEVHHNLGLLNSRLQRFDESRASYAAAVAVKGRLHTLNPGLTEVRSSYANSLGNYATTLFHQGDLRQSEVIQESALEHWQALLSHDQEVIEYRHGYATALFRLSLIKHYLGDRESSLEMARDSVDRLEALSSESESFGNRMDLAKANQHLGLLLTLSSRPGEATRFLDRAIEVAATAPTNASESHQADLIRVNAWRLHSDVRRESNQIDEAITLAIESVELAERLTVDSPPQDPNWDLVARGHFVLGLAYLRKGEFAIAIEYFGSAESMWAELCAVPDHHFLYRGRLAKSMFNRGRAHLNLGDSRDGLQAFEDAANEFSALVDDFPHIDSYRLELVWALYTVGDLYRRARQDTEASVVLARAVELWSEIVHDSPTDISLRYNLAMTQTIQAAVALNNTQTAIAVVAIQGTIESFEQLIEMSPDRLDFVVALGGAHCNLGYALLQREDDLGALPCFDEAILILTPLVGSATEPQQAMSFLERSLTGKAETLLTMGRADEALDLARQSISLCDTMEQRTGSLPSIVSRRSRIEDLVTRISDFQSAEQRGDRLQQLDPSVANRLAQSILESPDSTGQQLFDAALLFATLDANDQPDRVEQVIACLTRAQEQGFFISDASVKQLDAFQQHENVWKDERFMQFLHDLRP